MRAIRSSWWIGLWLLSACGQSPSPAAPQPARGAGTETPPAQAAKPAAATPAAAKMGGAAPPPALAGIYRSVLAKSKDLTYPKLESELGLRDEKDAPLGFDPTKVEYFDRIASQLKLTPEERKVYQQTGVVSVDHEQRYSMGSAYFAIYARDLPVLITTDSILHALHRSYDEMLKRLELELFEPTMVEALKAAHETLDHRRAELGSKGLAQSAEDVDLYLTVARNLLEGAGSPPSAAGQQSFESRTPPKDIPSRFDNQDKVQEILAHIASLELQPPDRPTELYGGRRPIDFSQYRPRGHYTESVQLQRYFRAMMWLGRADSGFILQPPDARASLEVDPTREARSAALLTLMLQDSGGIQALGQLRAIIDFMVGRSDNVKLEDVAKSLAGAGITKPAALADDGTIAKLRAEFAALGGQQIRSQVITSPKGASARVETPQLFQVFGQRFVVDSFVLSEVVFDSISFEGRKVERMLPQGFDVMAALGNDEAVRLLEPELVKYNYSANLLALRKTVEQSPEVFQADLYGLWLDALRTLDDAPAQGNLPEIMRREPWRRKQLQTQLASWAELRHDTVLYAKQSYSAWPSCGYPAGFVEPYPEFFRKVEGFARRGAKLFATANLSVKDPQQQKRLDYWRGSTIGFFERFAEHMEILGRLAQKELDSQPFTREEELFLQKTIDKSGGGSGPPRYDGWYPRLIFGGDPDKWEPTIADVHTDPQGDRVLYEGVGDVEFLVVAVDNQGDRAAYVGPVYSYYEFTGPTASRLTKEEWQKRIQKDELPARPAFTEPFRAKPLRRELGPDWLGDDSKARRIVDPRQQKLKAMWERYKTASPKEQNRLQKEMQKLRDVLDNPPLPPTSEAKPKAR